MKTFALAIAATAFTATAALASTDIRDFDANGDHFASKSEVAAVFPGFTGSDFRRLDGNRDGRISSNELQLPGARGIVGRYEPAGSTVIGIGSIDSSGDGFATYQELAVAYPGLTLSDFARIDLNDDRRVSFTELYKPLAQVKLSRHENKTRLTGIAGIDRNGDSFASFAELSAVYPGLSVNDFDDIDANDDRRVSFSELYSLEAQVALNRSGS
jgi:hypothetical protein